MFERYNTEIKAFEVEENQLSEKAEQASADKTTYAYLIYQNNATLVGINNNDEYYVITYDGMKPQEAIRRLKFKNLKTQYTDEKLLTDNDWTLLHKCHKVVGDYSVQKAIHNISGNKRSRS